MDGLETGILIILVVLLVVTLLIVIYLLQFIQKMRVEQLNNKLQLDNEAPVEKIEASKRDEISELKSMNVELKTQLKTKTLETAKTARINSELAELLQELREKARQISLHPNASPRISNDIISSIDASLKTDENTFDLQLDELHQEFFKAMKDKFPELTIHDLRLALYIKLGMNAKEIADVQNIKPSSVYISRSRLRKKIELDTDADLHGFLNSI